MAYKPVQYNKVPKQYEDGHKFDSLAEKRYYLELNRKLKRGKIKSFEMQVKYILVDKFKHPRTGKTVRAITYTPDFVVTYPDGSVEVIDIKGFQTEVFKIKAKLFMNRYGVPLILIKYDGRTGFFYEI